MSEKAIGVIGQKYEDRKTKKEGTVYSRDEENKRLEMVGSDDKRFYVSYASFKSNWRKAKDNVVVEESDKKEPNLFTNDLSGLEIEFVENEAIIFDNGIVVAKVTEEKSYCSVKAIPEIYVKADWGEVIPTNSLKFTRHSKEPTSLSFIAYETMEKVLEYIKNSIKCTNTGLYKEMA